MAKQELTKESDRYRIHDDQNGRYFGDGATFSELEQVRLQLVSYHCTDAEEPEKIEAMSLAEIAEYGGWTIQDMDGEEVELN